MTKKNLTKDDWTAAGFRALATDGPAAIQIKMLANNLGATKGSFYWHFHDLADFKSNMLKVWKEQAATDIITDVMAEPDPGRRFKRLLQRAASPAPDNYGGRTIEPAMRAWALADDNVSAALCEIDTIRINFIQALAADIGHESRAMAELIYAAYIGLDDLTSKNRASMEAALDELSHILGIR